MTTTRARSTMQTSHSQRTRAARTLLNSFRTQRYPLSEVILFFSFPPRLPSFVLFSCLFSFALFKFIIYKIGHPKNIVLLTCDAFGVLPPVSKLTKEQVCYFFFPSSCFPHLLLSLSIPLPFALPPLHLLKFGRLCITSSVDTHQRSQEQKWVSLSRQLPSHLVMLNPSSCGILQRYFSSPLSSRFFLLSLSFFFVLSLIEICSTRRCLPRSWRSTTLQHGS